MTREEILNGLYNIKSWHCNGNSEMYRIIAEAIKVLEQESCDDAISRQAVLGEMYIRKAVGDAITAGFIKNLQPVTPQPKIGKWIRVDKDKLKCSECEVIHLIAQYPNGKIDWCPNCGSYNGGNNNVNE